MDKRSKPIKVKRERAKVKSQPTSGRIEEAPATEEEQVSAISEVSDIVEGLLGVLERHEADANNGMVSLMTALMHAADRLLDVSTPEETERNRQALLGMLDHARRFVEAWPHETPTRWSVH
ncbi:MAG TPA: hypothetical protein VK911_09750 [Vicinamibacterales bacterium]|nr:hypothetical protein [Vicinamibacterales bacterium]